MPDEPIIAVSAKPARKRGCLTGCAVAGLAFVLVGGLGALWWAHRLAVARAEYAAVLRVRIAEWKDAHPPLSEEKNCSKLYDTALALHVPWSKGRRGRTLPFLSADFDARDKTIEKWLADNAAFLAALRKAQEVPGYDSGFRPTGAPQVSPLQATGLHEAIRLLLVGARNAAQSGRPDEALEMVGVALRLAREAGSDVTLTGCMISAALEDSVLGALRRILCESEPGAAAIRATIAKIDRDLAARNTPSAGLRGERVMMWMAWSLLLEGKTSVIQSLTQKDPGDLLIIGWRLTGADLKDLRQFDEAYDEALAAAKLPYPAKLGAVRAVAEKPREPRLVWGKLGSQVLSTWTGVVHGDAKSLAYLQIARLALGCRLYKSEKGAYPEKLSALSAAFPDLFAKLPEGPFSGKPFEYARTEKGCRVSNVGADGKVSGEAKPGLDEVVFELKR